MATYFGAPADYTCPDIDGIIDKLEKIRSDNKTLREYGDKQFIRAERAEAERDRAIRKCEALEAEINYLEEQLKDREVEYDK